MPEGQSRRFFLADLVFAALMCGLIVSLFRPATEISFPWVTFVLIVVVATSWSLFHAGRQAPTCEECGRRFIEPKKAIVLLDSCPHCGRKQLNLARSIGRVKKVIWSLIGFVPFFVMAAGVISRRVQPRAVRAIADDRRFDRGRRCAVDVAGPERSRDLPLAPDEAQGSALRGLRLDDPGGAAVRAADLPSMPDPAPPARGGEEGTGQEPGWCSSRSSGSWGYSAQFLLPLAVGSSAGGTSWITILLFILGTIAASFFALVVIAVAIQLLRRRQLRGERGAIAMARKWGGRDGEIVTEGPSTIWYSGPDDPVPMFREQMEAARGVSRP